MKVFVYKRKMKKGQKRERVETIEGVKEIAETNDTFLVHHNASITQIPKTSYIISVFGW